MQLDYSQNPAVGYPGMMADTGYKHVVSRVNPDVLIPFGRFVVKHGDDRRVKLPTTTGEVTDNGEGIAIQDWSSEQIDNGLEAGYPLKSAVSVMRQGRCWVKVEEAVAKGDPVFVRFAAGAGGTGLGGIRKSADTATAVAMPGLKFVTSAALGGLAIVEINLP